MAGLFFGDGKKHKYGSTSSSMTINFNLHAIISPACCRRPFPPSAFSPGLKWMEERKIRVRTISLFGTNRRPTFFILYTAKLLTWHTSFAWSLLSCFAWSSTKAQERRIDINPARYSNCTWSKKRRQFEEPPRQRPTREWRRNPRNGHHWQFPGTNGGMINRLAWPSVEQSWEKATQIHCTSLWTKPPAGD